MAAKLHRQLVAFALLAYAGRGLCFGLTFGIPFMQQALRNPTFHVSTLATVVASVLVLSSFKNASIRPYLGILNLVIFGTLGALVTQFLKNQPLDMGRALTSSAAEYIGGGILGLIAYGAVGAIPKRDDSSAQPRSH